MGKRADQQDKDEGAEQKVDGRKLQQAAIVFFQAADQEGDAQQSPQEAIHGKRQRSQFDIVKLGAEN